MSETSDVFNISGIKFCSICTKILHIFLKTEIQQVFKI